MKNTMVCMCCAIFLTMLVSNVFAGTGKGVIPQIMANTGSDKLRTTVVVSNITSHNLIVSFETLHSCYPQNNISYQNFINVTSTDAELPANSTGIVGFVNVDCTSPASIVWKNKSGENDLYGLSVTAHIYPSASTNPWLLPMVVNNNLPF